MSDSLNKKIADLKKGLKPTEKAVEKENSIIHFKENEIKIDRRHFNKRPEGSGRKPKQETLIKKGIRIWLDTHVNEDVEVSVVDKKTGKTIVIKKQRIMYILEKLYQKATRGDGDTHAMGLWLDRALGKAPQPLKGDENDDTPIKMEFDFRKILKNGYGEEDGD